MPRFPSRIQHVQEQDPVSAGVTSSAPKTLEARTNYLRQVIESIEAGRALVWLNQPMAPEVQVGQPVYWNTETQRYEQALAAVENDLDVNSLVAKPSADVTGMVLTKDTDNNGDIAIWGVVPFEDLSVAIDGDIEPGRYYLSAAEPGKLVRQRPAVTVSVCLVFGPLDACDENTWVFVMPQMRDFLEDHIHLSFELAAVPAGKTSPPGEGACHVITDPDDLVRGWLPADHESFSGNAPSGAKFGYNMAAHDDVDRNWPPIPISAVLLEMYKIQTADGSTPQQPRVGGRVPQERIVFDNFGIWWMSDCYGEVPWPTDYDNTGSSSSSSLSSESLSSESSVSSESSETCICPTSEPMELILSFIKMTFLTGKTVVTSLQPDEGQPLRYVNCDGEEATTGDLFSQLILNLLVEMEYYGGIVIKGITDDNKFQAGWAVEGVVAGSQKVTLTSDRQRRLVPGDASTPLVHQGIVTLDINVDPTESELPPQIVVLGDAVERLYKNIPYIGLPNGRDSGVRVKFLIPPEGLPDTPKFKVRLVIFGRGDATMTDLDTSYYRFARPAPTTTLTEGDTPLSLDTAVAVTADDAIEIESELIDVAAGDTLLISLERAADGSPTYDFEMGLIRIGGILVGG